MPSGVRLFSTVLLGVWSWLAASEATAHDPNADMVRAHVAVQKVRLVDNGDNDGFADPNETVQVYVTLRNGTGTDRQGLVVRMSSTDLTVGCIPTPVVSFGALLAGEVREASLPLALRVADVERLDVFQDLSIALEFVISGDDFEATRYAQELALDVDLNVNGGFLPTSYTEGFETAGFGSFTTQSLDFGRESLAGSDGHRCQYNDPDFVNSNSYGSTSCFLGGPTAVQNAYDWHVHGLTSPDGGRAYLGNNSLHWGVHPGGAGEDTTRHRQLDAIRTTNPVNLGWNGVTPELSFKHQVGLVDGDYLTGPDGGETIDLGIVQVQVANSAGQGVGSWRKIRPYENVYDSRAYGSYRNCTFDPTDDGNTEDDYFDPTDPARRLGPSSTCYPEFSFSRLGEIAFDATYDVAAIGHASDGPGLQGSRGPGTWVESKFGLGRWRGRRVRLRFLATTIEIGDLLTWEQSAGWNPTEADDGWYIDDVKVSNTLTSAATVSVDTADRSGLPACGPVCTSVTTSLVTAPPIPECGEAFALDASSSAADQCPGGALQFRFWVHRDPTVPFRKFPAMLQDWSENGILSTAMFHSSFWGPYPYSVDVRCSTLPACGASRTIVVSMQDDPLAFPDTIRFDSTIVLSWGTEAVVDAIQGDLGALRATGGNFEGSVESCLGNNVGGPWLVAGGVPGPGEGWYYLLRRYEVPIDCTIHSWSTGSPAEVPGAGGDRDEALARDPSTCP